MKLFKLLLITFGLYSAAFALPALAQQSYSDMTIEQLQAIDQSVLDKKEKKKLEKILKKKIKAKKKAEKAAKRAEAKKRKAEAVAAKKREKALQKKLKKVMWSYKKTKLQSDEFSTSTKIVGGSKSNDGFKAGLESLLGANENIEKENWFMRSFIRQNGSENHQFYISFNYVDRPRYYNSAIYSGGIKASLTKVDLVKVTCGNDDPRFCAYEEDVAVNIPKKMLLDSYITGTDIRVAINSKRHRHIQVIPGSYIRGYVKRMAELIGNVPQSVVSEAEMKMNQLP